MQYNFLKDNLIIVCSNNIKEHLIKYCVENKLVFNIKYMSFEDFFNNLTFSYDEKTIVKVMDKFSLDYSTLINYLDNIKYLGDESSDDKRILLLEEIKNFCLENKLLNINNNFKYLLNNKEIIFVGYDYIDNYYKKILCDYNIKYEIIDLRVNKEIKRVCYEFANMEDEVHYIAEEISSLVEKGIDINKIFIANVNENYNYLIKRIFKLYKIPFNASKSSSLYETTVGKYFLDNIDTNLDIINVLKDKFKNSIDLINMIISLLNKYCFIDDFTKYKNLLIQEFKKQKLEIPLYDKAVNIIDLKDNIILDDEYVFLVGFNLGVVPKIYRNEDYFSDEIKFSYMEKTRDKNILEKNCWIKIINSINNLSISYSLGFLSESLYASNLIEDLGLSVIKSERSISKYSDGANRLLMNSLLDNYYKFGLFDERLNDLLVSYQNVYNSFDNRFKGIDLVNSNIVLSYSSMNTYYKCAFRYYLANVLKIDIYNENFSQFIGNLFHFVLEHYYNGDKNIDDLYDKYIKENGGDFSFKERFFIDILKKEMHFIIKSIDKQNELSHFKDCKLEEKFVINYGDDIFKGFIDKILYKDNDLVIIDYKTGNIDIDLSLVPYGLSLQLPVYLYLAKKNNKDARIVGFYLQHILNSKMRHGKKKYEFLKRDALKLQGYSLGNAEILEEFDESFRDSSVIKGMKFGNNGFYYYSKVLSDKEIDNIYKMVDKKIKEAFTNIRDANFVINPKVVLGHDKGCEFCKFKDICFRKEKDKVYLNVDTDCTYLGGDDNA